MLWLPLCTTICNPPPPPSPHLPVMTRYSSLSSRSLWSLRKKAIRLGVMRSKSSCQMSLRGAAAGQRVGSAGWVNKVA
jgi:hypothetical protein